MSLASRSARWVSLVVGLGVCQLGSAQLADSSAAKTRIEPLKSPQIFAGEFNAWPDLARVERVLNRQPFQSFTSIESLAWLDGSRTLIVGDRSGISAWDVKSQSMIHRLRSDALNYNVALTSRTGNRVITSGDYRKTQIRSWPGLVETPPKQSNAAFNTGFGMRYRGELSPDGKFLAQIVTQRSGDTILRVLDCDSGETIFERKNRQIRSIAWDPQNRFVVVGEHRGTVIFVSMDGELIRRGIALEPREQPTALSMSADGTRLLISTWDFIAVYEIRGRRRVWQHTFKAAGNPERSMNASFSADSTEVIVLVDTQDEGTSLLAMDSITGERKRRQRISTHYDSVMAVSPDGKLVATVGSENNVILRDAHTFAPVAVSESDTDWERTKLVGNRYFRNRLVASPNGQEVLMTGYNRVTLWDVLKGDRAWSVTRPMWFEGATWNRTSEWIVTVTRTNVDPDERPATLQFLDPADGRVFREVELPGARGHSISMLADDRILVTARKHVFLRDSMGKKIWTTSYADNSHNTDMVVSPDEKTVAVVRWKDKMPNAYSNSHVELLDVETGKKLRKLESIASVVRVAFSADGSRLFGSTTNYYRARGRVQLILDEWDVASGKRINNPHIPDDEKYGEDFVRTGTREELWPILDRSPLLTSDNYRLSGKLAMHASHHQLVIARPISSPEEKIDGIQRWSNRLMLWDVEKQKSVGEVVLPGSLWDVVFLRSGKLVTANNNRSLFVIEDLRSSDQ